MAAGTSLDEHPFLRLLLDPRTLTALSLRIDPDRLAAHRMDDRDFFFSMVHDWKQRGWLREEAEAQMVFDVLTAIFLVSVQRDMQGEEASLRATRELAEAVAERWCPPDD